METNRIICGDNLEVLRAFPDNCIDAIVTDPPYGWNFMGKGWDHGVPGERYWREFLRVAKPGAHLLAFGGTRTYHRLVCAIEDAGWEVRDCLMWVYACVSEDTEILTSSGWKRYNEVRRGEDIMCYDLTQKTFSLMPNSEVIIYDYADTAYRIQSTDTDQLVSRNHRCIVERGGRETFVKAEALECQEAVSILEDLPRMPDKPQSRRQQAHEFNAFSQQCRAQSIRRQNFPQTKTTLATVTPVEYQGKMWCVSVPTGAFVARRGGKVFVTGNSGFPKSTDISKQIDKKLGAEREVVGKRGDGRYASNFNPEVHFPGDIYVKNDNVEKIGEITAPATPESREWEGWGSALKPSYEPILWARKPPDGTLAENTLKWGCGGINIDESRIPYQSGADKASATPQGKVTSKEISTIAAEPDAGRNLERVEFDRPELKGRFPSNLMHDGSEEVVGCFGDSGSAARFFFCSKASKSERGEGNTHPTVKPLSLMQYLIRLVTPPKGVVLDPFNGSGSTTLAARNLGVKYLGIEKEREYCNIALRRLGKPLERVEDTSADDTNPLPPTQLELFP